MLLLACVLVFSFALHAKLGVYVVGAHPDPSTASKLWMSDATWHLNPAAPPATLIWLAVLLSVLLGTHWVHRGVVAPIVSVREQQKRQYLHRFLRPPPTR
jgi:hypothetical protein